MTTLVEHYEVAHARDIAECLSISLPAASWRSPDGVSWTPQSVLCPWQPRTSDHWAWLRLHAWVLCGDVEVRHIELPSPLLIHDRSEAAWRYVRSLGGVVEDGPGGPGVTFGRVDLVLCGNDDGDPMLVEFGTCSPLKFVLNLGTSIDTDWMIVPFHCPFAFVFRATRQLFTLPVVLRYEDVHK